jgi:hypothetical protein
MLHLERVVCVLGTWLCATSGEGCVCPGHVVVCYSWAVRGLCVLHTVGCASAGVFLCTEDIPFASAGR